MTETKQPSLRWTPAGMLTILAVVVLALVTFSLGVNAGLWIGVGAALAVLVLGLFAAGLFYQGLAERRDRGCFPAPGRRVEANGLVLHAQVLGNPRVEPVIILENGEMSASPEWAWVAPELARFSRVFLYDRPGTGWSPTPAQAVTAKALVEALHQALTDLDLLPPYILVGHGMGALLSQAFYAAYPESVHGIVLVDPLPAELASTVLPQKRPGPFRRLAVRLGLPRLLGQARQDAEGLPEEEFAEMVAFLGAARNLISQPAEGALARSAIEMTRGLPAAENAPPVTVFSASEPDSALDASTRTQMMQLQSAQPVRLANASYQAIPGANRFSIVRTHEFAAQIIAEVREMAIRLKDSTIH